MLYKREAELKSLFTRELHRRLPGFYSLLLASAGAPDRAIVGIGQTTFLEFKHGTPSFESTGLQELTCMRLAEAGRCQYVIWHERRGVQRTLIVHPRHVHDKTLTPEAWCIGFDMRWLCAWIRKQHSV